jgi:hypothetical protein
MRDLTAADVLSRPRPLSPGDLVNPTTEWALATGGNRTALPKRGRVVAVAGRIVHADFGGQTIAFKVSDLYRITEVGCG